MSLSLESRHAPSHSFAFCLFSTSFLGVSASQVRVLSQLRCRAFVGCTFMPSSCLWFCFFSPRPLLFLLCLCKPRVQTDVVRWDCHDDLFFLASVCFSLLAVLAFSRKMLLLVALLSLSLSKPVGLSKGQKGNLPSCDGCYSGFNGINYACCNDMSINNGVCTCDGNVPCAQCSPDLTKDKEKAFASSFLPSCGGCFSGINNVDYTCADCSISITNGKCICGDGSLCERCSQAGKIQPPQTFSTAAFGGPAPLPESSSVPKNNGHYSPLTSASSGYLNLTMTAQNGIYYHDIVLLDLSGFCGQTSGHPGDTTTNPPSSLFYTIPVCGLSTGSSLSFDVGAILWQPQNNMRSFDWFPLSFQIIDQKSYSLQIQGYSHDVTQGQIIQTGQQTFSNCQGYYWNFPNVMNFNWYLCYQ